MPKNIILLSDGTGNSSAKLFKTNVWRLYQALDLTGDDQIANFDDGVGTSSFKPLAILGGTLGYGLKRNVVHLYMFLCRHYKPGDRIFGFGFSRGAFTIRLLMGLVAREGLVPYEGSEAKLGRDARNAYRAYRRRTSINWTVNFFVTFLRILRDVLIAGWDKLWKYEPYSKVKKRNQEVDKIHFLGLWDTVDAYGLPMDEMTRGVDLWIWPLYFADQNLSPKVERACHALSIDDERTTFHPVLWNEAKEARVFPATSKDKGRETPITNVRQERLSQVWFAGVHADVGGGYPDDGLAHVPLKWIMDEAESRQLKFKLNFKADMRQELVEAAVPLAPKHNSRNGLARYYRYGPRKIKLLCNDTIDSETEVRIEWPKIHHSVFKRIEARAYGYAPIVLPDQYAVVMEDGEIRAGPYDGVRLPVPPNPYEHGSQSASRANRQEAEWNAVWYRRLLYFVAVFATAYLVFFPLIHGSPEYDPSKVADVCRLAEACKETESRAATQKAKEIFDILLGPIQTYVWVYLEKPFGSLTGGLTKIWSIATDLVPQLGPIVVWLVQKAVDAVRSFVPGSGFLRPWLSSYGAHEYWFAFGAAVVLGSVAIGSWLRGKIFDDMRAIWKLIIAGGPKKQPIQPPPTDLLCRIRTSKRYLYYLELTKWYILPTVFAWIFFYSAFMFVISFSRILAIAGRGL